MKDTGEVLRFYPLLGVMQSSEFSTFHQESGGDLDYADTES
jgi:hypothetical protein